jgi:hypothetical protein
LGVGQARDPRTAKAVRRRAAAVAATPPCASARRTGTALGRGGFGRIGLRRDVEHPAAAVRKVQLLLAVGDVDRKKSAPISTSKSGPSGDPQPPLIPAEAGTQGFC